MRICGFVAAALRDARPIQEHFPEKELHEYWTHEFNYHQSTQLTACRSARDQRLSMISNQDHDGVRPPPYSTTMRSPSNPPPILFNRPLPLPPIHLETYSNRRSLGSVNISEKMNSQRLLVAPALTVPRGQQAMQAQGRLPDNLVLPPIDPFRDQLYASQSTFNSRATNLDRPCNFRSLPEQNVDTDTGMVLQTQDLRCCCPDSQNIGDSSAPTSLHPHPLSSPQDILLSPLASPILLAVDMPHSLPINNPIVMAGNNGFSTQTEADDAATDDIDNPPSRTSVAPSSHTRRSRSIRNGLARFLSGTNSGSKL